ncbi:uncharacterized protein LOC127074384 [Lathyrus oleraceus]|uniref:uncharacterized protein LOC127074384 n=1 Tax=Pisum sativum TaxID=3888 RepID=UPI0021D02746|nr:uncharacterized protein LOC127074384 [Pisum sativum]
MSSLNLNLIHKLSLYMPKNKCFKEIQAVKLTFGGGPAVMTMLGSSSCRRSTLLALGFSLSENFRVFFCGRLKLGFSSPLLKTLLFSTASASFYTQSVRVFELAMEIKMGNLLEVLLGAQLCLSRLILKSGNVKIGTFMGSFCFHGLDGATPL